MMIGRTLSILLTALAPTLSTQEPPKSLLSRSFSGSLQQESNDVAVSSDGSIYLVGSTNSADFTGILGGAPAGWNTFILKLSADGANIEFVTLFGGSGDDFGRAIVVDSLGNAYITGKTTSSNLPTTYRALDRSCGSGGSGCSTGDGYVAKFTRTGVLIWSTYIGAEGNDIGNDIAIDPTGAVYLVGTTNSQGFPTKRPLQSHKSGGMDGFLTKLSSDGSLIYSTFFGGASADAAYGVSVDAKQRPVVVGITLSTNLPVHAPYQSASRGASDGFVVKLEADGQSAVFATYLGGSADDELLSVATDPISDAIYVAGGSRSTDFPTQSPLQPYGGDGDFVVAKIAPDGSSLVYSTYIGGPSASLASEVPPASCPPPEACTSGGYGALFPGQDRANGIAVDATGRAYVVGFSYSFGFPIKHALEPQPELNYTSSVTPRAVILTLPPDGRSIEFATYYSAGSGAKGLAVGPGGRLLVTGDDASAWTTALGTMSAITHPSPVDLGIQIRGTPVTYPVRLENTGDAPLIPSAVSIEGLNAADFTLQAEGCAGLGAAWKAVAAGEECSFGVVFSPTATGLRTAQFKLAGAGLSTPLTTALLGTGTSNGKTYVAAPKELDFGGVQVGRMSTPAGFQLRATGTAPVTLASVQLTGIDAASFTIDPASSCASGTALSPGTDCRVLVASRPGQLGPTVASLEIRSDAMIDPIVASLTATGVPSPPATISAEPLAIEFPARAVTTQSSPAAINLTNIGASPLVGLDVTFQGLGKEFLLRHSCTAGLAAGKICRIDVTFAPQHRGLLEGLVVVKAAGGRQETIPVRGVGTDAIQAADLSGVVFGEVNVGRRTSKAVNLRNATATDLVLQSIAVVGRNPGDFQVANTTATPCVKLAATGVPLTAGATCALEIAFTPARPRERTAVLRVTASNPAATSTIPLSGNGIIPDPSSVPLATDRLFVTELPSSSTTCAIRATPITFSIKVTRYVGKTNDDGTLADLQKLVSNGVVGESAVLVLRVYNAGGVKGGPEPVHNVTFNGHPLEQLHGSSGDWTTVRFVVPTEWILFAQNTMSNATSIGRNISRHPPTPGVNAVRVNVDAGDPQTNTCISLAWGSLRVVALSPVILVHCTNCDRGLWQRMGFKKRLDELGIPNDNSILIPKHTRLYEEPNDNGQTGADVLAKEVPQVAAAWGVQTIHLVGHSMGGLHARQWLAHGYKETPLHVLSLITLSTPHEGAAAADIRCTAWFEVHGVSYKAQAVANELGCEQDMAQMMTDRMEEWNLANLPQLPGTSLNAVDRPTFYWTIGADADINRDGHMDCAHVDGCTFPDQIPEWDEFYREEGSLQDPGLKAAVFLRGAPGIVDLMYHALEDVAYLRYQGIYSDDPGSWQAYGPGGPNDIAVSLEAAGFYYPPVIDPNLVDLDTGDLATAPSPFVILKEFTGANGRNHYSVIDAGAADVVVTAIRNAQSWSGF